MPVINYIYDGHQYLAEADDNDTINRLYTNKPDTYMGLISHEEVSSEAPFFYHYDAIGSTRGVSSGTEMLTDEFTYDAWGNQLSRTGTSDIPFQYVGEHSYYYDGQLLQYYVRARHYSSSLGRWTSFDPLSYALHQKDYIYVLNNPTNLLDPTGLVPRAPKAPCSSAFTIPPQSPGCGTCKRQSLHYGDWELVDVLATDVAGSSKGPDIIVLEITCYFERVVLGCYKCPKDCYIIPPKTKTAAARLQSRQTGELVLSTNPPILLAVEDTAVLEPRWYKLMKQLVEEQCPDEDSPLPDISISYNIWAEGEKDEALDHCSNKLKSNTVTPGPLVLPKEYRCDKPKP